MVIHPSYHVRDGLRSSEVHAITKGDVGTNTMAMAMAMEEMRQKRETVDALCC